MPFRRGSDDRCPLRAFLPPCTSATVGDLRPWGIIQMLDLVHPMYRATAAYGHFGREPVHMTYKWKEFIAGKKVDKSEAFTAFTWEKTDKAEALRKDAGL